jgi:hypothetical protein
MEEICRRTILNINGMLKGEEKLEYEIYERRY